MEFNDIDPIGPEEDRRRPAPQSPPPARYLHPSQRAYRRESAVRLLRRAGHPGWPLRGFRQRGHRDRNRVFVRCDGWAYRASMGTESAFGREFDSLADVVSFGIAPAFLAYAWGVRSLAAANAPDSLHLRELGWLVGFFFVACCAWRLARFNIQGMAPGGSKYFVGMPTPAAAGMIASIVHLRQGLPISDVRWSILWLALLVALGVLMSSSMRFYSFKDIEWTRRRRSLAIILLALVVGAAVKFSGPTLFALTAAYTAHGPIMQLIRFVRHRTASRTA